MGMNANLKKSYSTALVAVLVISLNTPAFAEKPGAPRSPDFDMGTRADSPTRVNIDANSSTITNGYDAKTNEITSGQTTNSSSVNIARPGTPTLLRDSNLNRPQLSQSGSQRDPADASGQLTRAGRALQKHSNRPSSSFERTSGPPANWNNTGQMELNRILENPNSTIRNGNRHNGYDIVEPSGKGAAFDNANTFRGFLEPTRG